MLRKVVTTLVRWAWRVWNRQIRIGRGVFIDPRAFLGRGGEIVVGEGSTIRGGATLLPAGGKIHVGRGTTINHYCVINGDGGVRIGDAVSIAAFVAIYSSNHVFGRRDLTIKQQGMTSKGGVSIEDDVWIGTHVAILDGVTIGRGSVVGAGAVVTKDVPPMSVVAGVPAKVIRQR